jgi:hypothetical protein
MQVTVLTHVHALRDDDPDRQLFERVIALQRSNFRIVSQCV